MHSIVVSFLFIYFIKSTTQPKGLLMTGCILAMWNMLPHPYVRCQDTRCGVLYKTFLIKKMTQCLVALVSGWALVRAAHKAVAPMWRAVLFSHFHLNDFDELETACQVTFLSNSCNVSRMGKFNLKR